MSDVVKDRCIVCNADKVYGSIPVCKECQGKQEQILETIVNKSRGDAPLDRDKTAADLGVERVVVDWCIKTNVASSRYREKIETLAKDNLSINERIWGNNMWLEIGGKIDSMNAEKLKEHIAGLISDGWKNMILDMSGIAFFSSTGIRVVLATYKQLHAEGGSFFIENPSQNVRNVLGMVALNTLLLK